MSINRMLLHTVCVLSVLTLNACHGNSNGRNSADMDAGSDGKEQGSGSSTDKTYSISALVSGLSTDGLILQNNGGDDLTVAKGATKATFSKTSVSYKVTIKQHPVGLLCNVAKGSGTATANVSDIRVACQPISTTSTFHVSVAISGLQQDGLILQNNGTDDLEVKSYSSIATFSQKVSSYQVTIKQQPNGQVCSITAASGQASPNVGSIKVVCSLNSYTLSATVSGLNEPGLVLQNLGLEKVAVAQGSQAVTFTQTLEYGRNYNVQVTRQPSGFTTFCKVTDGKGKVTANVKVTVTCVAGAPLLTRLAGKAGETGTDDGFNEARFNNPVGMTVDSQGILYLADASNHRLRILFPSTGTTTFMGKDQGYVDGEVKNARFNQPVSIVINSQNVFYIADKNNFRIRQLSSTNGTYSVSTLAGLASSGAVDGPKGTASFAAPHSIAIDGNNHLFVTDVTNHKIRQVTPAGDVSTFVGQASSGNLDGDKNTASFNQPAGIVSDQQGSFYVADAGNHRIRKITSNGDVLTLAGSSAGYNDAQGNSAQFNNPQAITVDSDGNLYVADTDNHRIRKITASGAVTTLAGTGSASTRKGLPGWSWLNKPQGIAIDKVGTLYITTQDHVIQKLEVVEQPQLTLTVSATITGLTQAGLVLLHDSDHSEEILSLGKDATSAVFSRKIAAGSRYHIQVKTQPSGLTCTVINNTGTARSNITVEVQCSS